MKTQQTNLFSNISKKEMEDLTTEVRETLATDHIQINNKIFSAAELWNIQRHRRTFTPRRN